MFNTPHKIWCFIYVNDAWPFYACTHAKYTHLVDMGQLEQMGPRMLPSSNIRMQFAWNSRDGYKTLRWHHNGRDSVSNHQPQDCLLNCLFRRRSKKTSKLRVTGLCVGNSPGTGEFHTQMASYAENVSIWWRHHEYTEWFSVTTKHAKMGICQLTNTIFWQVLEG